jgi:hypothetical protein
MMLEVHSCLVVSACPVPSGLVLVLRAPLEDLLEDVLGNLG